MAMKNRSVLERRFDTLLAQTESYSGPAMPELAKLLEVWVAELAHTKPMFWSDHMLRSRVAMLEQILNTPRLAQSATADGRP